MFILQKKKFTHVANDLYKYLREHVYVNEKSLRLGQRTSGQTFHFSLSTSLLLSMLCLINFCKIFNKWCAIVAVVAAVECLQ